MIMTERTLTVACWDYDRTRAVLDGRVVIDGWTVTPTVAPPGTLFPLAVGDAPYDVTEMSLASYLLQTSRGEGAYIAVPAFVSRAFRHDGFYVRADAGIATPKDLEGRRVGVPEFQMTAAVWMRGLLADEFDVDVTRLIYRTAGLNEAGRKERLELTLPDHMDVAPAPDGTNLNALLLAGDLDAIMAPAPPTAFANGDLRVRRLFSDAAAAGRDYYARTGIFPLMHVMGVRKTLAEAHPDLARGVYNAFLASRRVAMDEVRAVAEASANKVTLPWFANEYETTRALMGDDFWPYGFSENVRELEALCRYANAQYLTDYLLAARDLFHPDTLDVAGR